jgi:hypothetical protein
MHLIIRVHFRLSFLYRRVSIRSFESASGIIRNGQEKSNIWRSGVRKSFYNRMFCLWIQVLLWHSYMLSGCGCSKLNRGSFLTFTWSSHVFRLS